MSWADLEGSDPDLAATGAARLAAGYASRHHEAGRLPEGPPRLAPRRRGRLFVFVVPASPKGHDLRRDGRYALHSAVGSPEEGQGELLLTGEGPGPSRTPPLAGSGAVLTVYEDGRPVRTRWKNNATDQRVD